MSQACPQVQHDDAWRQRSPKRSRPSSLIISRIKIHRALRRSAAPPLHQPRLGCLETRDVDVDSMMVSSMMVSACVSMCQHFRRGTIPNLSHPYHRSRCSAETEHGAVRWTILIARPWLLSTRSNWTGSNSANFGVSRQNNPEKSNVLAD